MAYFKVDARQIKSEAHAVDESLAEADEHEESVVGSRPNLVASFPPHVQLRLGDEVASRGRHAQPALLRRSVGCAAPLAASSRRAPHSCSAAPTQGHRPGRRAARSCMPCRSCRRRARWRRSGSTSSCPTGTRTASTANDTGGLTGPRTKTGLDPTDPAFYHGGDLQGLTGDLQRIKNLGFTALWVTPVLKQRCRSRTAAPAITATGGSTSRPSTRTSARDQDFADLVGQGARARAEGVPRRRRQPHGRRRAADGDLVHRHPVPRLPREALRTGALRAGGRSRA